MPHDPKALQILMETASPPGLELGFRPMFGGITAYANGAPFASLSDVGLALKMTGTDHAALAAVEGVVPLRYAPDQPASKTYLVVPGAMLADEASLRSWIARSAAASKPPAAKKRTRPVKG